VPESAPAPDAKDRPTSAVWAFLARPRLRTIQAYRSLDIANGYGDAIVARMSPEPVREFIISGHARFEMERRGISDEVVRQVLESAEQRFQTRKGRVVFHSRVLLGVPATMYLVRVVVDVDRRPAEVVTVYRTTKLSKYWREEP
jgi:Domain of unknown function (DUF4258)